MTLRAHRVPWRTKSDVIDLPRKEGVQVGEPRYGYMISVLAPDRSGIIADVSRAIYELGGNLEAASQTIMQGWFTMLVRVTFPSEVTGESVQEALHKAGDFDVIVRPFHERERPKPVAGEPYVMSAVGEDKPGIVHGLSRCCARRGVNIEDVWNEVRDGRFIIIFHLAVPRDVDPKDFRYDLERVAGELGVALTLQHQDIFTATNSLQVHTRRRVVVSG